VRESLQELWQHRALIQELTRRDLKLRYKNSLGGVAWSLLNPLMQIAAITLVMKFLRPSPVSDYSAYLLGALFLWNFMQAALGDGAASIVNNASLVRKIYFPRAVLPISALLSNLFHFSISFGFTLLYLFVLGSYPQHLRAEFLLVVPVLFFACLMLLGINFVLSFLNVHYEDVRFIVQAVSGILFYLLPLLYTVEDVRAKLGDTWKFHLYMLNPATAFLTAYQRALLYPPVVPGAGGERLPPLDWPQLWPYFGGACVLSVLVLVAGFALFERFKWEMAEQL
jgi:ABC-type polysaccharide/polyol phosphate export permease